MKIIDVIDGNTITESVFAPFSIQNQNNKHIPSEFSMFSLQ